MSARGLEADFKPATTIETELVERLAGLLWRLRRVPVFEAALMQAVVWRLASAILCLCFPTTKESRLTSLRIGYGKKERPRHGQAG